MKCFEHLSTDLEAPVIDRCPGDIKTISKRRFTKLVLPGVKVTDNVGVHHFVTNVKNGSEVTFGQHNITYTASDKAGNKAYCRFHITIAGTNNLKASSRAHNLEHLQLPYIRFETSVMLRLMISREVLQANRRKKILFTSLSFLCVGVICFVSNMDSCALDHIFLDANYI